MITTIAVKERPMAFSPAMVRAIFADTKTQTRRAVTPHPIESHQNPPLAGEPGQLYVCPDYFPTEANPGRVMVYCKSPGIYDCMGSKTFIEEFFPYGRVGDRLWVREQARIFDVINEGGHEKSVRLTYAADSRMSDFIPWPERLNYQPTPGRSVVRGIFREAARLLLEITGVRVERLQDISEDDAKAEGCEASCDVTAAEWMSDAPPPVVKVGRGKIMVRPYTLGFIRLWESINGAGAWASNPWVWVVSFKRIDNAH